MLVLNSVYNWDSESYQNGKLNLFLINENDNKMLIFISKARKS